MLRLNTSIAEYDSELAAAIAGEEKRQQEHVELIASENYTSPRVLEAQGSILTNKYAEGYPAKRYYGGCEFVDVVEQLAIDRACELFGAGYANVQPHSGSQANAAVYQALMSPGDTFLGMELAHGGHLTHGAEVNFSGQMYKALHYGIDPETARIDYAAIEKLALSHKPKMIVAGFSAYSRVIDWQRIRDIADQVGAYFVVDMAHVAGLVAVGEYPSPVRIAHVCTSTTHKTLAGPRGGLILTSGEDAELNRKLNFSVFPGTQGGPLMHVIAGKAVCFREAMEPAFKQYQQQTLANARVMVDEIMKRGYDIVTGGTDNHLFLVSLIGKDITGKAADAALDRANIAVNKNTVPNDPQPPFITSGLRMGTPAVTRRGMGEEEVRALSSWVCDVLDDIDNEALIADVRNRVIDLCRRFPVYGSSAS